MPPSENGNGSNTGTTTVDGNNGGATGVPDSGSILGLPLDLILIIIVAVVVIIIIVVVIIVVMKKKAAAKKEEPAKTVPPKKEEKVASPEKPVV